MTESEIKRLICDWITAAGGLVWLHARNGRIKKSKYLKPGIADILGVWKSRPLAIEVKKPNGKVSDEQTAFLTDFNARGGIAFVARDLGDVIRKLEAA